MKTKAKEKERSRLDFWQAKARAAYDAYSAEITRMERREKLYAGGVKIEPVIDGDDKIENKFCRNVVAEMIENQVDTDIPQPKVQAYLAEDEKYASLIEDMIRGELDRMPVEMINDMTERTGALQGGVIFLVEWDTSYVTHTTIGAVRLSWIHPKQFIPQPGVYTDVQDMDYMFLTIPQTKESVKRRYGIDVTDEAEELPDAKGVDGETTESDMVTQWVCYYRNDKGGIGKFSWVNDTILEDLDDYQARRLRRCENCGSLETPELPTEPMPQEDEKAAVAGLLASLGVPGYEGAEPYKIEDGADAGAVYDATAAHRTEKGRCPYCGGVYKDGAVDYEEIVTEIRGSDGRVIVVGTPERPVKIPYYKPDMYPVVLIKNISQFGRFLGASDADALEDIQNEIDRINHNINEKLMKGGSFITLPASTRIDGKSKQAKIIRVKDPSEIAMIRNVDLQINITNDLNFSALLYEAAKQRVGITDSYLGRPDTTAQSGIAKEFSARQAAGRLESKRVMKRYAYSRLFELIYKFMLAYSNEARPVHRYRGDGTSEYVKFSKWDFLRQDAAGEWYWEDRFLFSVDAAAPLASNREGLWQETRQNLLDGLLGDPRKPETLITYWSIMERLHYPNAGQIAARLREELQAAQAQQTALAAQAPEGQAGAPGEDALLANLLSGGGMA